MNTFWHQAPLVRLLIPFLTGVLLGIQIGEVIPFNHFFPLVAALICFGLLAAFRKYWKSFSHFHLFGWGISLFFFFVGFNRSLSEVQDPDLVCPVSTEFIGVVNGEISEKANSFEVPCKIEAFKDSSDTVHFWGGKVILYISKHGFENDDLLGKEIAFSSRIKAVPEPLNPFQFDYGKHLKFRGIAGTGFVASGDYRFGEHRQNSLHSRLVNFRSFILRKFEKRNFDNREFSVMSALLLGYKSDLNPELRDSFADAGAIHVLAVSGLHVGIIYLFFAWILKKFRVTRKFPILSLGLILILLWVYAGLTGFSPSVLRAATMFSFIAVGKQFNRHVNIYNMLGASCLILLLFNPFLIMHVGFQLSYLAVVGIIYLHPKIYGIWEVQNWLGNKIWSLTAVSIAAQIATFPLSIYYFHQFPNWFFLSNLAVIPLSTGILYLGMAAIIFSWAEPVFTILSSLTFFITFLLNESVEFVKFLPAPVSRNIYFSMPTVVLMYIFIALVTSFFVSPQRLTLRIGLGLSVVLTFLYAYSHLKASSQEVIVFPAAEKTDVFLRLHGNEAWVYFGDSTNLESIIDYQLSSYLARTKITKLHQIMLTDALQSKEHPVRIVQIDADSLFTIDERRAVLWLDRSVEFEMSRMTHSKFICIKKKPGPLSPGFNDDEEIYDPNVHGAFIGSLK